MRDCFIAAGVATAIAAAIAAAIASPALAAEGPYSGASEESAEGVAALAEAGVKTVSGVVAVPLMLGGLGSQAAGSTAANFGEASAEIGGATSQGGFEAAQFATSPLSVTDEVVLKPQPAPQVPAQVQAPVPAKPK